MSGAHPAYRIEGPALISFSGGRTSAYMLHEILRAHDGKLPDDVHVTFANTGKEREETLRFVHECESRWGVRVNWLEWAATDRGFAEVGYNSASRNGEPFAALIEKKGYLPNSVTRYCTLELKIRVMRNLARSMDWRRWDSIVGLRADEPRRIKSALARNASGKEPFRAVVPLYHAGVTVRTIDGFWGPTAKSKAPPPQGFKLEILPFEGNCDGCFLKAYGKLCEAEKRQPGILGWWVDQERAVTETAAPSGARFVTEYSYADIQRTVAAQPEFPWHLIDTTDREHDAECGAWCAAA